MQLTPLAPAPDQADPLPRAQLVDCLVAGLHFLHSDAPEAAQSLARRVLANIILEHLYDSGYVITHEGDPIAPFSKNDLPLNLNLPTDIPEHLPNTNDQTP